MLNNERPVGASDDKSTNVEAQVTSSPNNGNTLVMCSQSGVSPEATCEKMEYLPEPPWHLTIEGWDKHYEERLKSAQNKATEVMSKHPIPIWVTVSTVGILALLLILEVLTLMK
jgi:hypothetical protein